MKIETRLTYTFVVIDSEIFTTREGAEHLRWCRENLEKNQRPRWMDNKIIRVETKKELDDRLALIHKRVGGDNS